jgi:hypothetical protein
LCDAADVILNKMSKPDAITFIVEPDETEGFTAFWDDPAGGGITTEGDSLVDLQANILDAVRCHFGPQNSPRKVLLHFAEDVALEPA